MTDYTNYEDFMTHSTKVGGLDEIHSHILQLTTEVKEQNKVIKSQVVKYKTLEENNTELKEHIDEMEDSVLLKETLTKVDSLVSLVLFG